jgi:hypothetical protein
MRIRSQAGAATVEHAGLVLLIALLFAAAIAPGPCWQDPLTLAYGRPLAGAVRALAPAPVADSGLLPVDFRYCRSASCAMPGPDAGHTASNRRVTAFVAVDDRRRSAGIAEITYWLYRPTVGWEAVVREASSADVERLAPTPLLDDAVPSLVPLETLDGRNQHDWAAGEEPPWRWRVESVYP